MNQKDFFDGFIQNHKKWQNYYHGSYPNVASMGCFMVQVSDLEELGRKLFGGAQ